MGKEELCESCQQKEGCEEIYRRLGRAEGPSVALKVVTAFLVPMAVFIITLAAFEHVLAGAVESAKLRTGLSVVAAASVTFVCILAIRALSRASAKDK